MAEEVVFFLIGEEGEETVNLGFGNFASKKNDDFLPVWVPCLFVNKFPKLP